MIKKHLLSLFLAMAALIISSAKTIAQPTLTFSGGGTNSEPLFIDLSDDITFTVKPGAAVNAYAWGLTLPSNITQSLFSSVFVQPSLANLQTSQGAFIQVTNGDTPIFYTNGRFTAYDGYPTIISFMGGGDYTLTNGGSFTITKGIIQVDNNPTAASGLNYYVLNQQNLSFALSVDNAYGNSETPPGFNTSNLEIVPEPSTYALFALGVIGLLIAWRRRAA